MSRRSLQIGAGLSENALISPDRLGGLETAAAAVLKQAVEMDNARRHLEALTCYREGIGLLMDVVKSTNDDERKQKFRVRIEEYMNRAEKLKILIDREKRAGRFHEQFRIPDGGTGYSYEQLLKPFLDDEVTRIEVEDAYIRIPHQLINFLRFCEFAVRNAANLKHIDLTTGQDEASKTQQEASLKSVKKSLADRSVTLTVQYSSTLHDREIRFNNGWVIKIGRGLDYFKPVPKFTVGYFDMDLRPCHETTVDVFHRSAVDGKKDAQNLQQASKAKTRVRFA